MSQALQALQWAAGGGFVLLGVLTFADWLRHRDRSRQYLALSVGLLGAVAMLGRVSAVTSTLRPVVSAVSLVAFMASAFAFVLFRDSLIPLHPRLVRAVGIGTGLLTLVALIVTAMDGSANPMGFALAVVLALILSWCALVGVPIVSLWRAAAGLPSVQRARLHALNGGYSVIILVLIVISVAAVFATQNLLFQIVVECVVLASLPLLYVAFAPPSWLRRFWREREEEQFRRAINDLLLYSPDVVTLAGRAVDWARRLLGGDGGLILLNDEAIASQGIEDDDAQHLVDQLRTSHRRQEILTRPGAGGTTAVVPLRSEAGSGVLAVVAGPFTPLLGEEELARLRQYAVSITAALDRVHLSEGIRRSSQLLELAYDAVFTWDCRSEAIQFWNRAAAELYGFTAEEAIGRKPDELLQTHSTESRDQILETLFGVGHWEGILEQIGKDGRHLYISARWALQRDRRGDPLAVLEINRDVSIERQAAEELRRARDVAQEASLAKSEYLSRMSHELRTPLAAMLGFSDLLEMREPREDQMQAIDAIQRAGSHLLSLVNDVLDIARIESGRESLSLEPVQVNQLLEECADLISRAASEHRMTLEVDVDCPELHVRADRQRLVQVLLNLLSNAIKYGRPGGRIDLHAASHERSVQIEVTDDGEGLSEEQQQRLFQPFERVGAERTVVQGTGLGLALCRQLTSAMGGVVGVRSAKGEGSTFWVRLQQATVDDESELVPASGPAVLSERKPTRTVLYVEDNLATVGLVESIFAMRPHIRLITAMQGGLAVELATEHRPDLIVLDVHLPDLNGDEVMHRLRDKPATAEIPVVMYSADATQKQVSRLLSEGAAAYLTKPARVTEFLEMLDGILDHHPSPAMARRAAG